MAHEAAPHHARSRGDAERGRSSETPSAQSKVDQGGFVTAAAEAVADGDEVDVTVVVVPHPDSASGFELHGGDIDKNQTIHATGVGIDDQVTEGSLEEIRTKVLGFYASHGYTDARVAVRAVDVDAPLHVLVAIDIDQGKPRTFARRVFVIDPVEDGEVGELKRSYGVALGG